LFPYPAAHSMRLQVVPILLMFNERAVIRQLCGAGREACGTIGPLASRRRLRPKSPPKRAMARQSSSNSKLLPATSSMPVLYQLRESDMRKGPRRRELGAAASGGVGLASALRKEQGRMTRGSTDTRRAAKGCGRLPILRLLSLEVSRSSTCPTPNFLLTGKTYEVQARFGHSGESRISHLRLGGSRMRRY
jgi:hypothetical protein